MFPDDEAHIAMLCQELRPLLDAELTAGNRVAETWRGDFPYPHCLFVMLERPFLVKAEPLPGGVEFVAVDDPHYWKSEYLCPRTNHALACRYS